MSIFCIWMISHYYVQLVDVESQKHCNQTFLEQNRVRDGMLREGDTQEREYYALYTELQGHISKAYFDSCILKAIDFYNDQTKEGKMSLPKYCIGVISHVCELAKCDLCLTLWKITDTDKDSNTLHTLQTYLRTKYGKDVRFHFSKQTKNRIEKINTIRNEFLGHIGKSKSGTSIPVLALREVLEEARCFLNALCFPNIDKRVTEFSVAQIYSMESDIQFGLAILCQGANTEDGQ